LEDLIAAMAAKLTCRYGRKSLAAIAEHCEMADAIGDQPSLEAWRSIGAAAEDLLAKDGAAESAGGDVQEKLCGSKAIRLGRWTPRTY